MSLADAFYPAEVAHRRAIQASTWGHLEPRVGPKYKGEVIFGVDRYGTIFYLKVNFRAFPGGPFFHELLTDYFAQKTDKLQPEALYRWKGYHRRCKNGAAQWGGKINRIRLP